MKVAILNISSSDIACNQVNDLGIISSQLYKNGFEVEGVFNFSFSPSLIKQAIDQLVESVDCLILACESTVERCYSVKKIISDKFNCELVNNDFAKNNLEEVAKSKNVPLKREDYSYSQLPSIARCIKNPLGVFQGFLIEKTNKLLFFLPSSKMELHNMFFSSVLPYLLKKMDFSNLTYIFKVFGLTLNELNSLLKDQIKNKHGITIVCQESYLDSEVVIRLSSKTKKETANEFISLVYTKLLPYIYNDSDKSLCETIFDFLEIRNKKLVFAEGFTSGELTSTFNKMVSGASSVLAGSFFAFTKESQISTLGVTESLYNNPIIDFSQIAYEMCLGAMDRAKADISVSSLFDEEKSKLYFAIGNNEGIHVFNEVLQGTHEEKIKQATNIIFYNLIKKIKQYDFHIGKTVL